MQKRPGGKKSRGWRTHNHVHRLAIGGKQPACVAVSHVCLADNRTVRLDDLGSRSGPRNRDGLRRPSGVPEDFDRPAITVKSQRVHARSVDRLCRAEEGLVHDSRQKLVGHEGRLGREVTPQEAKVGFRRRCSVVVVPKIVPEDSLYAGCRRQGIHAYKIGGLRVLARTEVAGPGCPPNFREPQRLAKRAKALNLGQELRLRHISVGMYRDDVEALRPGSHTPEKCQVNTTGAGQNDVGMPVGTLYCSICLTQKCSVVVRIGSGMPEGRQVRLVPHLPIGDSATEVSSDRVGKGREIPTETGNVGMRHRPVVGIAPRIAVVEQAKHMETCPPFLINDSVIRAPVVWRVRSDMQTAGRKLLPYPLRSE